MTHLARCTRGKLRTSGNLCHRNRNDDGTNGDLHGTQNVHAALDPDIRCEAGVGLRVYQGIRRAARKACLVRVVVVLACRDHKCGTHMLSMETLSQRG